MSDTELTYTTLRNELARRVFQYTFSGPLLLVWSLGLLAFIALFERPLFALVWTGAVAALGFLMAADYLRTPKIVERLVRSIVQKKFPAWELTSRPLHAGAQDEVAVFTEITLKIFQIEREKNTTADLRHLIPMTHRMVSLLRDSAREVEELERALNVAKVSKSEDGVLPTESAEADWAPNTRQESIEEIRREIDQARFSIKEIVQHLETLMLRLFQIAQLPGDPVRDSELVREVQETVMRLTRHAESRRADRYASAEVQQTREVLDAGFSEINSSEGVRAVERLVYEYAQLKPILDHTRAADATGFARISLAVEETYRAGLGLLRDLLDLMRTAHPSERRRLEDEIIELEKNITLLRADKSQKGTVKLMETKMNFRLERLDLMQKQQLRIDELLHLAGRCEESLNRTRMELAGLKTTDSEMNVKETTESLRQTIAQAKEIREELKKLGF
ncbi:MAG TPA: hypothetical protein VFV34_22235 [Blastocatellia bacterium]|nr:hypothetical protein [Blastocatellia bacterium]